MLTYNSRTQPKVKAAVAKVGLSKKKFNYSNYSTKLHEKFAYSLVKQTVHMKTKKAETILRQL